MRKELIRTLILIALYVLLGNARSIEENPFIPGASIAVNMIVPITAGILFGKKCGFFVGILGTLLNSFTPAGSIFEILAILPHGIMGYAAGLMKQRYASPIAASAILVGHVLNIVMFSLYTASTGTVLLEPSMLMNSQFWFGIISESIVDVIAIMILIGVYRVGFE